MSLCNKIGEVSLGYDARSHHQSSGVCLTAFIITLTFLIDFQLLSGGDVKISQPQATAESESAPREVESAAKYPVGRGLPTDFTRAAHWRKRAAGKGNPEAQDKMGLLLLDKYEHSREFTKAARPLRMASSAGNVPTMNSLGFLFIKHPGLAGSPDAVRISLETAAGNGSWKSSAVLGILAREGNGVAQKRAAAYDHFQVAILQGSETAQRLLVNDPGGFSQRLSAEQTRELASNGATWLQRPLCPLHSSIRTVKARNNSAPGGAWLTTKV
jgi:hypothetical protein